MFELILGECQLGPDLVFKILICRIRPKIDRIRNRDPGSGSADYFNKLKILKQRKFYLPGYCRIRYLGT